MPLKRLPRKRWYTLQDAAGFLQTNTDESSPIKQEELLQYASEGLLSLSIKLFSAIEPENFQLLARTSDQKSRMGLRTVTSSRKRWENNKLCFENTRTFLPDEELIPERILALGEKEMAGLPLTASENTEVMTAMRKIEPEDFNGKPEFFYRSELIEGVGLAEPVDRDESAALLSRHNIWQLILDRNATEIINQVWRQCHDVPDLPRDTLFAGHIAPKKLADSSLGDMELLFRAPTNDHVLRICLKHIPADTLLGVTPENLDSLLSQPSTSLTEDEEHISHHLQGMNEASFQFWSTAEKDNAAGQPSNETVAKWLQIEYGFSKSKAYHAASLIRPSWAATGRKPTTAKE